MAEEEALGAVSMRPGWASGSRGRTEGGRFSLPDDPWRGRGASPFVW